MNDKLEQTSERFIIIWRQAEARLKQDGYNITTSDRDTSTNDKTRKEIVYENGIKYVVYPESNGQKTGFFCDQRDNRMMIGR